MAGRIKPKQIAGSLLIFLAFGVILFPLLLRSRGLIKRQLCGRNLGLMSQALHLYVGDNDGRFPMGCDASDKQVVGMWDRQPEFKKLIMRMPIISKPLAPYAKSPQIFRCPADVGGHVLESIGGNSAQDFENSPSLYDRSGCSYLFRTEIVFRSARQKGYWPPSNVAIFFDAYGHWHGEVPPLDRDTNARDYAYFTKNYRCNVLFADGNVKPLGYFETQDTWSSRL